MDLPRRPDRDEDLESAADPESAADHEQAGRFRDALRDQMRRLDADYKRLRRELAEQVRRGHGRLAAQTESALSALHAERRELNRMLSELARRFPRN